VKKEVEDKIKALKDMLDTGSKEDLETKTRELSDSLQKIGQAAYQQGQQAQTEPEIEKEEKEGQPSDSAKATSDKGDVQEGEVVN